VTWHRIAAAGLLLACAALLAVVGWALLAGLREPSWGSPAGEALSPDLSGGRQVGQTFTSPYPGLSAVRIALEAQPADGPQQIAFHLEEIAEPATELLVRSVTIGAVHGGVSYRFDLPPESGSQGRGYRFWIESAPASGSIAARYSPASQMDGAHAIVDGRPVPGNLRFETLYTLTLWQKLGLLAGRMPVPWPILMGVAVLYALVLGVLLQRTARHVLAQVRMDAPEANA
jgi:hypothetical protein